MSERQAGVETNGRQQTNGHAVGTRTIRPDGVDKVTGRARFGADHNLPGQLIGRVPIHLYLGLLIWRLLSFRRPRP